MYAIYNEGGIFIDADMFVLKKFDRFLHHSFFSLVELIPNRVAKFKGKINQIANEDGTLKSSRSRIF